MKHKNSKRKTKSEAPKSWPELPPKETGLKGLCPRCGQGKMFKGFLKIKEKCEVCDLDYSYADPADGPAFFVITFGCLPSMLFAVWLQINSDPSWWVHLITTFPFMLLTAIPPLRPLKGWLVASQYFYKAEEGTLVNDEPSSDES